MDNVSTNRTNMIRTTISFCDQNTVATSGINEFAPELATATNKLVLIDELNKIGEGTTTGVTLDTQLLRDTMNNIAFKLASATFAYASRQNDNTLKAIVDYARSDFDAFKIDEVDDICENIHDAADTNIGDVQNFGVDATDVTDLATAINLYRVGMQNPRQKRIEISQAKEQYKLLIREVIDIQFKERMDKMVNTLKETNTEFFDKYYKAREIIDLGRTSTKIRGTVSTPEDEPIQNATVILRLTGQPEVAFETTTNRTGNFNISEVKPENYDIEISHSNWQVYTETNVRFGPGKELKRAITLQPLSS